MLSQAPLAQVRPWAHPRAALHAIPEPARVHRSGERVPGDPRPAPALNEEQAVVLRTSAGCVCSVCSVKEGLEAKLSVEGRVSLSSVSLSNQSPCAQAPKA